MGTDVLGPWLVGGMTIDIASSLHHRLARPLLYAGGLALVWLVAAAVRPEVTYHLAPLLVAGTPPAVLALDGDEVPSRGSLGWAALLGFAGAVVVAFLLAAPGWLEGPAFEPFTSALVESITAAALGAVVGSGVGVIRSS